MEFDFSKEPGRALLKRPLRHDGTPLMSVVTPYYNAGKHFEQTYNCVMNQTFPWFEWLIVDDGSTDAASLALLSRLAETDGRIRLFRQENTGPAAARNRAAAAAVTDILVFLDADDLIEPTYLEIFYWAMYCHPEYAWAYSNSIGFQDLSYVWNRDFSVGNLLEENFLNYSAAIRKSSFLNVNGFDEKPKFLHEDWVFWVKLLSSRQKPVKTANYGFWYRRLDSGRMAQVNDSELARKQTSDRIRILSKDVDRSIAAKAFPVGYSKEMYGDPKISAWERKVFAKHDKIHVLMLLPWTVMGGADLFNLEICSRLDKTRFELGIITTKQTENSWQQRFAEHVTDIFNLPEFLDVKRWPEFISYYIKSREVDVLFLSNSYYGYYLLPWLRKEFPQLAIVDYVHTVTWYWQGGGYARLSGIMGQFLDKTYVCNEWTRQSMIQSFKRAPETVETLYIGTDEQFFDPAKVTPGLAKAQLGLDESQTMILFPCRVEPEKRPFLMLAIAKRLPGLAFAVVGDGAELEALKDAVKREKLEDAVFFAGRQSDMRPWYRDAALTLICSLKEGLALTAYESLAMGVPVVTSDVGGQAELIDRSVGRVVPLLQREAEDLENRAYSTEEVDLYVNAIRELLAGDACGEACRKRITEGFSSRLMIRRLTEILTDLARDPDARFARLETAQALRKLGNYVDDALSVFLRLEAKDQEAEEIWKGREWFRTLYEQEKAKAESAPTVPADAAAQETLDWIYHMRSWKLVRAYCRFMDETRLGRVLRRIRDFFRA